VNAVSQKQYHLCSPLKERSIGVESSKRNVMLANFVAFSMVLSIVEWFIPLNFVIPGVKLGLANIVIIVAIHFLPFKDVLLIILLRAFMTLLISANIVMLLFSLAGGVLSGTAMYVLLKLGRGHFSIIGMSILGAFVHNISQITVAMFLVGDSSVFLLLPILGTASLIAGFFTGVLADKLWKNTGYLLKN
jgi:heptaprenyl diphosphate synthase